MSFRNDTLIKKVRKPRKCDWCREMIEAGHPAVKVAGISWDGDFSAVTMHPECHAAEARWWKLPHNYGVEGWPDERMPRGSEFYREGREP